VAAPFATATNEVTVSDIVTLRQAKEQWVAKANWIAENVLDGTMEPVRRLIEESEIAVAVWQDADEPDGVGFYIIKGDRLLRTIISENKGRKAVWTAIPCECYEQAVALKDFAGEPPAHN
jgi:hypothetical protein